MKILAGDIGGTNTRLIISEYNDNNETVIAENNYPSNHYTSLEQVIACFLTDFNITQKIDIACFAVAGPVVSGKSKVTNLPWSISEEQLEKVLNIPRVKLINDFMAVALGISKLEDKDILLIQQGSDLGVKTQPDSAIIGAGTGLGVAHRVWIDDQYHIFSSETGHTGFAPENERQTQLLAWLQKKKKHVSLETVLSGGGLYKIYQFLRDENQYSESFVVKNEMLNNDPAQIITEYALANDDELCSKTLDIFVSIYGSIAGDIALHYYPVDELLIAGGIAPRLKDKIATQQFLNAFRNKGLMSENMQKVTIKLILNDKVGLYGALSCSKN